MPFTKRQTLTISDFKESVEYQRINWFKREKWYSITMSFLTRLPVPEEIIRINNIEFKVVARHHHTQSDHCWHITVEQINPTTRSHSKHTFQYTQIFEASPALA